MTERVLLSIFSTEALEGRRVLDVGCGPANFTQLLCRLGCEVTGVDVSPGMIRVASSRLSNAGLAASLILADAQSLPFRQRTFDLVLCCGDVLDYIADVPRALNEISRVLKPGGLTLVVAGNRATFGFLWYLFPGLILWGPRYDVSPREGLVYLFGGSDKGDERVAFPHGQSRGSIEFVPLRATTYMELRQRTTAAGLRPRLTYGIHILTELLPYIIATSPRAPQGLRRMTRALSTMDHLLADVPPFSALGGHLLLVAEKVTPKA